MSKIAERKDNLLVRGKKLFQQFIIDLWLQIEKQRLFWMRRNQHLFYSENFGDQAFNQKTTEKKTILPAGFIGSNRHLDLLYNDACSLISVFGKPDVFLTFTFNPSWDEIKKNLKPGENYQDRPDLCIQVFNAKFQLFLQDIKTNNVFGVNCAFIYSIEYQKRGSIHAHVILWSEKKIVEEGVEFIDKRFCAIIPDKSKYPRLYEKVVRHMIHDPCDERSKNKTENQCILKDSNKCSKKYPYPINESTIIDQNGDVTLKRPSCIPIPYKQTFINNSDVITYNPYLLQKYNCHLNVEPCKSSFAAKYLFKYIYKGYASATMTIDDDDEISKYETFRYISGMESVFRLYGCSPAGFSHKIVKLSYHLEDDEFHKFLKNQNSKSMLVEFFETVKENEECKNMTYLEFACNYMWKNTKWVKRVLKRKVIARIFCCSAQNIERFCLRLLLIHVKGPTSFTDLLTVNNKICKSYREACEELNLYSEDEDWEKFFSELIVFQMPEQLRKTFCSVVVFTNIKNPKLILHKFYKEMTEDLNTKNSQEKLQKLKEYLQKEFKDYQKNINNFELFDENIEISGKCQPENEISEKIALVCKIQSLNKKQKEIFDNVTNNILCEKESKIYVDGCAGAGKTFLFQIICEWAKTKGINYKCFAATGLASLFYDNSSTIHSGFLLPLHQHEAIKSYMHVHSQQAKELKKCQFFILDEISMCSKFMFDAINSLMMEICGNNKPFGGKTIILGGDFKQLTCIINNNSEIAKYHACVKTSQLFELFNVYKLEESVRQKNKDFGEYLTNIGRGVLNNEKNKIKISKKFILENNVVDAVYGQKNEFLHENNTILTTTNACVKKLNESCLNKNTNTEYSFFANDILHDNGYVKQFSNEYLHQLTPSGLPDYELKLKVGAPVVLLKNISASKGLVNGTRGIILEIHKKYVVFKYTNKQGEEDTYLLHKFNFTVNDSDKCTIKFTRMQIPCKLCYSMTVHKAQGQTFEKVGIYMESQMFSHGMIYTAMSRVKEERNLVFCFGEEFKKSLYYDNEGNAYIDNPINKSLLNE